MAVKKIEFIESYIRHDGTGIWYGNGYEWKDNHGELVRCANCKHYDAEREKCNSGHITREAYMHKDDYCSWAIKREAER